MSGNDTAWVDATFVELERVIMAARPQLDVLRKYRWALSIPLAFVVGYSWFVSIDLILRFLNLEVSSTTGWPTYFNEHPEVKYLTLVALWGLPYYYMAWSILGWIGSLWPDVEFDFGPEHLKINKKIRGRLTLLCRLILLPLGLAAVNKYLFH